MRARVKLDVRARMIVGNDDTGVPVAASVSEY
jgi:hypothetical protein